MDKWQLIETAPKDGTPVLVWGHLDGMSKTSRAAYSAWWEFGDDEWMTTAVPTNDEHVHYCVYVDHVTHWQPLPEPPTPDDRGRKMK